MCDAHLKDVEGSDVLALEDVLDAVVAVRRLRVTHKPRSLDVQNTKRMGACFRQNLFL